MKNKNQPVYPIVNEFGFPSNESVIEVDKSLIGITKREYFSAIAMQGLLSGKYEYCFEGGCPVPKPIPSYIAALAIECADSLLEQLSNRGRKH